MQSTTDNRPDNRPDNNPDNNPLTSGDDPDMGDSLLDGSWDHVPDDDGSTWESYQDDGTFPSWL